MRFFAILHIKNAGSDAKILTAKTFFLKYLCIMCSKANGGRCAKIKQSFAWVAVDQK